MHIIHYRTWGLACALACAAPAWAATAVLEHSGAATAELGSTVWFNGKVDGVSTFMYYAVNGVAGGNATYGTLNAQNGEYRAPLTMPANAVIAISAASAGAVRTYASTTLTLRPASPAILSVNPLAVNCGAYTLNLTGTRFTRDSVVWISDHPAPTTFTSDGKLSATGKASANGVLALRVVNAGNVASAPNYQARIASCGTAAAPAPGPTTGPAPAPAGALLGPKPAIDAAQVSAARFLEQASFGYTPAELAAVKAKGQAAWLAQQFALPASPMPLTADMTVLRNNWYKNMAGGQDQLRQRMIFALSQLFVVSANKNPYANEIQPWLSTLSTHAFGNFNNLLREMTLNPAMGKYLDLGNSMAPAPNENYAREVMQLFTIGPTLLNQDGSVQTDRNGEPIPSYDQARIGDMARALSGWTYSGPSSTGLNWESFGAPLQARNNYHDKGAKTLLNGVTLPEGQSASQDYDAVMRNLFEHPNLPPFIATRLIRAFVTSNPSPAYISRVARVFGAGPAGRGDLKATLTAVLSDPEARQDQPGATRGHLKDPMLHSISLFRALGASVVDPTNLFWDYFLIGEKILNAPSVFNFYSPMTRLPDAAQAFGPEFQVYAPSLAVARANLLLNVISGNYKGSVNLDITPYVNVAGDPTALLNLVDATLLAGRMSANARQAIGNAVMASGDKRQRAITALYLSAISAEFAVIQ